MEEPPQCLLSHAVQFTPCDCLHPTLPPENLHLCWNWHLRIRLTMQLPPLASSVINPFICTLHVHCTLVSARAPSVLSSWDKTLLLGSLLKLRGVITSHMLAYVYWLQVRFQIDFKMLLLMFKALSALAPKYISVVLTWYAPSHRFRSVDGALLVIQLLLSEPPHYGNLCLLDSDTLSL